jgi:hypothetical protein
MMRRVAIEVGSWRCGLSRGTAGPEVARRAEAWAAKRACGRKSAAFGNQEAVGGNAERGMMMEAAPGTALEVVKPQFLLEFLEVALDSPAQLGRPDQLLKWCGGGKVSQPILGGFGGAFGPFDEQPLLAVGDGLPIVAMGSAHPDCGKARAHHAGSALTPSHRAPGCRRQATHSQFTHRQGLMGSIRGAGAWAVARSRDTEAGPAAHCPRAIP